MVPLAALALLFCVENLNESHMCTLRSRKRSYYGNGCNLTIKMVSTTRWRMTQYKRRMQTRVNYDKTVPVDLFVFIGFRMN